MKTRNLMLAALALIMLAAPSCATLNTAAVEQEEIITKERATGEYPGRFVDANGWEFEAMGDGD